MRNIFHVCLYIDLCHLKLPIANIDSCFSWTALMDISVVVGHILHWILNICIWLYLYISIYYYWKWTSVHWVDHFLHWIPITEYWILKICIWLYLYINLKECEVLYIWDQKKGMVFVECLRCMVKCDKYFDGVNKILTTQQHLLQVKTGFIATLKFWIKENEETYDVQMWLLAPGRRNTFFWFQIESD